MLLKLNNTYIVHEEFQMHHFGNRADYSLTQIRGKINLTACKNV